MRTTAELGRVLGFALANGLCWAVCHPMQYLGELTLSVPDRTTPVNLEQRLALVVG